MKACTAALTVLGPLWLLVAFPGPALAQYSATYAASPITRMVAGDSVAVDQGLREPRAG